ncbi:hypothetical protein A4G19_09115 [Pasteurellaceae bacterium Macca]|nr:hypothetical protein [Pasteurellaceae bacterium Macca]
MNDIFDFYRNVTFFKEYDVNSFIGRWLDYSEWNDVEYSKLERDLLKIAYAYREKNEIHQDILVGVMRIIELLMVPDWRVFIIESNTNDTDIYDRYERFKYIISVLFTNKDIILDDFFYSYSEDIKK